MIRLPATERPAPAPGAATAPTVSLPRVLDLTLRIGELLLAGGEGAEDVEAAMFGVAFAYGLARVEPTVTFTLLGISYQPSLTEPPVTMSRTVRRRGTDYTRLAAVFHLVDDITAHEVTLEDAYRSLADIRRNRHPYGSWVLTGASGLLAGAASMLVGGNLIIFVAAASRRDARRPARLAAGRARAAGVLPVRGGGDARRRHGRGRRPLRALDPRRDRRPVLRGHHRWPLRAAARPRARRRRPGRPHRLLHHRVGPAARGDLPRRRHRRRRHPDPLRRRHARRRPQPGPGAARVRPPVGAAARRDGADAGVRGAAPVRTRRARCWPPSTAASPGPSSASSTSRPAATRSPPPPPRPASSASSAS